MEVVIEKTSLEDTDAILGLLAENKLPLDGIRDHLGTAVVARSGGEVVGVAALEVYADGALMRSVAVSPAWQRHGLGHRLTDAIVQLARDLHALQAYLLTTTAERYFAKFGFERIERQDVPPSVQQSIEFQSACPASAVVMRKAL